MRIVMVLPTTHINNIISDMRVEGRNSSQVNNHAERYDGM
jgi:hypothetical protein